MGLDARQLEQVCSGTARVLSSLLDIAVVRDLSQVCTATSGHKEMSEIPVR